MSDHPAAAGKPGRRPAVPDLLAGGTFIALGLAFALGGRTYDMGSALKMGPGYVPVVLGGILTVLGAVIAVQAFRGGDPRVRRQLPARAPHYGGQLRLFNLTSDVEWRWLPLRRGWRRLSSQESR